MIRRGSKKGRKGRRREVRNWRSTGGERRREEEKERDTGKKEDEDRGKRRKRCRRAGEGE